jgi:hypothetical protein
MKDFAETMRLKGKAEEDIYFAKRDQELIAALHQETLDSLSSIERKKAQKVAHEYEKEIEKLAKSQRKDSEKLSNSYAKKLGKLLDKGSKN